jgi:DNA-binding transcriptional LysR family regulator
MELRLLRTFKAVAEAGSFTHAASHVHLTQAAVSVHIRQLEEELGSPLFLRVNKKLYLTEVGRALLSHAESILRAHDEAKAELTSIGEPSHGRLHIGVASTAITVHPLPEILSEIKRKYSMLDFLVIGETSERIIEQILTASLDAGLVSLPVEQSDVAVMSPQHKLARARAVTTEELSAEPLILGEHGGNTRRLIDLFFEKSGVVPKIIMELQRTEAIIKMVELGFGVTILPEASVHTSILSGRLRAVAVRELKVRWEFGVAYLKSEYRPPALESFLQLCRKYIGNQPAQTVGGE